MSQELVEPIKYSFLDNNRDYTALIRDNLDKCLTETSLGHGNFRRGKVRDSYELDNRLILITTDRQSAFDRVLASIPLKGQVLNLTSAWWFENTSQIVKNHVVDIPHPNVTVAEKCQVFPIEFVMRGYITGTTSTALWTHYNNGSRNYCGNPLPDGLLKNQPLDTNIITPTTKAEDHDRPISPAEIVSEGWMSADDWQAASAIAQELFAFGQKTAKENGLILVDTKYEIGQDDQGNIVLVDEIHTPDSSRYWIASSYEDRFNSGVEPENIDKEFLRLWFVDNCDPYNDAELPPAPEELRVELSRRYIMLYEMITGQPFPFVDDPQPAEQSIRESLSAYLGS
ncbi:MAG: phosphoribosylaminoimidazolesuccinocarboxamide synthase [Candidatus Marinimicrobia bacterium]|nr:phosphoribosylaminoimidazolesuccinocarboxamide synthase [Candidatus Neomarinimicrobiota bacterium]